VAADVDSERRSMLRRIQEQALAVHQLSAYAAQAQQQQQQQQCSSTRSESGMPSNRQQQQQQQQQVRSTTVHDRWSSDWCKSVDDQLNNSSSFDRRVVNSSISRGDSHRVRSSGAGDGSSVCSNASSSSCSSGVSDDRASYVLPVEDASMYRHSYRSAHMASSQQQQQQQQLQQLYSSSADVTRLPTAAATSALYESGITDDDVYINNNNHNSDSRNSCNHECSSREHAHHWDVKHAKR
jgi:hypothetical protein